MTPDTRKKIGLFLGILLFIVVVGVFTVPRLIDLNRYKAPIVSAIEKATGGKAQLGRITWSLYTGLWLEVDGFSLEGTTGAFGDVAIKRARIGIALLPILAGKIIINDLLLEEPDLNLNLAATGAYGSDDIANITSADKRGKPEAKTDTADHPGLPSPANSLLPKSAKTDTSAGKPRKFLIAGVTIRQGRLTLNDALTLSPQTIAHTFTDISVTADYADTDRAITFELSLRDENPDGLGSLAAKGTFVGLTERFTIENPQLTIKAAIKGQNIDTIKPYLKNDRQAERLGGSVSFEIDINGNFDPSGKASGTFDLTHLTYTDPSKWNAPLPGMPTELTFAVTFTPDEFVFDNVSLTVGSSTIDGRSRIENWKTTPAFKEIGFSADILLAEFTPLLPWKQMGNHSDFFKEILAGGGQVSVDKARLAELDPSELATLWNQIELEATVTDVSVQPTQTLSKVPKASNISAAIRLANGVIDIDHVTADISAVSLPEISAQITQLPHQPQLDVKLQGPAKVADLADESLHKLLIGFGFDKLAFTGDLDLAIRLQTARLKRFSIEGTVSVQDGLVKTTYSPVVIQGFNADVTLAHDKASVTNLAAIAVLPAGKSLPANRVHLSLQGQITDFNRRPTLSLESLKTSPVSLAALAAVLPWERFANTPKIVKDILHDGGTIEINQLSLPAIDLAEPFNRPDKLLSAAKGSVSLAGLTVRPILSLPAIEGLSGHPSMENGVLTATDLKAQIGPITTPTMTIQATHLTNQPKYKVAAKGPVRVVGTADESVEQFLQKYGFKELSGNADVVFDLSYDSAHPDQWSANGFAILEGIQAESHPGKVKLNNLRGRISFVKQKSYECALQNLTAEIAGVPIQLDGKLSGTGEDDLTIDLKANAHQLDLAAVSELVPALKDIELRGKIDLDMDIHLPHSAPLQNRLTGKLKTDQLEFHHKKTAIRIEDINSDLDFNGRLATINRLSLRFNEQLIDVSGQMSRPEEPVLDLVITSPDLDIDRILPDKVAQGTSPEPQNDSPPEEIPQTLEEEKIAESEKPRFLRLSSAKIRIEAQRGRFRRQDVQDLRITADYQKGIIKDYTLNFNTGGGHAAARGMIDIRHPDHVAFTLDPEIHTIPLKTIVSLLGFDEVSVDGPLSASGQLEARAGSPRELLASLNGNLNADIGRGQIRVRDSFGKTLAQMLRFMRPRNLLSGSLVRKLEGDGLLFNRSTATATIDNGQVQINTLEYDGEAFSIDAEGSIDLPGHRLKVFTKLAVFGIVGKAVKAVPIIGKAADAVSSLYFTVDGPLNNPKVRLNPARGVVKGTEEIVTAPQKTIEDIRKFGKE